MGFYLNFNDLSCSAKEDLINYSREDYLERYGFDELYEEMAYGGFDLEDILFHKVLQHMTTITIYIK